MKRMYIFLGLFGFTILLGAAGATDMGQTDGWTTMFRIVFGTGLLIAARLGFTEATNSAKPHGKRDQTIRSKAA